MIDGVAKPRLADRPRRRAVEEGRIAASAGPLGRAAHGVREQARTDDLESAQDAGLINRLVGCRVRA